MKHGWWLAFVLLGTGAARAETAPSVAVAALQAQHGVTPGLATLLTDALVQHIRDAKAFSRVVSSSEISTQLGAERAELMSGCDSEGCVAELAGALGVDYLLIGNVGKIGTSYVLNARLLDVKSVRTVASRSERFRNDSEEAVLDGLPGVVRKLLDEAAIRHALGAPPPPVPAPAVVATPAPASPTRAPPESTTRATPAPKSTLETEASDSSAATAAEPLADEGASPLAVPVRAAGCIGGVGVAGIVLVAMVCAGVGLLAFLATTFVPGIEPMRPQLFALAVGAWLLGGSATLLSVPIGVVAAALLITADRLE
ncbi:MAG: hypothetical protein AB2A00_22445 [Myxococcota bacterium]